jgi:hypothetical protein
MIPELQVEKLCINDILHATATDGNSLRLCFLSSPIPPPLSRLEPSPLVI